MSSMHQEAALYEVEIVSNSTQCLEKFIYQDRGNGDSKAIKPFLKNIHLFVMK